MPSNACISSTTSIYMLSITDFDPKGTVSEVRVHTGPHLDIVDADPPMQILPKFLKVFYHHGKVKKKNV